jgi:murein L,D-transpeptidase YcbB/YkuD
MLQTAKNTSLGTQNFVSDKVLYKKGFKTTISFLQLGFAILFIMMVNTSYVQSPGKFKQAEAEYFSKVSADSLSKFLAEYFDSDSTVLQHSQRLRLPKQVWEFYSKNHYKPVWTHSAGISRRATQMMELLTHSRNFGLEGLHYHTDSLLNLCEELKSQNGDISATRLGADFEMLMTDAVLSFMTHLHAGYVNFDSVLFSQSWMIDLPGLLMQGIKKDNLQETVLSVQPEFIGYQELQKATEKFVLTHQLTDQWINFTNEKNDSIKLWQNVSCVLVRLGYLKSDPTSNEIHSALMSLQKHHGLHPDGRCGRNTLEALGQSTLHKYYNLALNLDRLRKLDIADRLMLYVNIPSYKLRVMKNNKTIDTFRVIVGKPISPTPRLTGKMLTIISNPMWYVPKSITVNEILPRMKSDSGYLKRNGFKILDENFKVVSPKSIDMASTTAENFAYKIRQNRGSDNSLGQVKFIFSNPYSVYLHDTPGKQLFSKDIRAFSHGCIRLEDPEMLADYIIRELNKQQLNFPELVRRGKHQEVPILTDLPIHIRYITCEGDDKGNIYFYKDIYGLDRKEMDKFREWMGI